MTDIIYGEKLKKILRYLLKTGYKMLRTDMEMAGRDLEYNPNLAIRNLNALIVLTASHLKQKDQWQKKMTLGYGQGILWTVIKDTAYRDPFFWALDKLLEHPEEMRKLIKPYVKPPEEWIANMWTDSKNKTNKLQQAGKLMKGVMSLEESIFTPDIQDRRHKKILGLDKNKK